MAPLAFMCPFGGLFVAESTVSVVLFMSARNSLLHLTRSVVACVSLAVCEFWVADFVLWYWAFPQDDGHCSLCLRFLFSLIQQEVENFRKLNLVSKEEFDHLAPELIADQTQEILPGSSELQKGK